MKKNIQFFLFIFLSIYSFQLFSQKMVISVPVADLRTKPQESPASAFGLVLSKDNPLQNSQLLLNEYIALLEERGEWIKVMSIEQPKFYLGKGWVGQTGWIKKSQATAVSEFPIYDLIVKEHGAKILTYPEGRFIYISTGTKLQSSTRPFIDSYLVKLPNNEIGSISPQFVRKLRIPNDEQKLRQKFIKIAGTFLNTPYSWGGRSSFDAIAKIQTGTDCSGFINLIHRVYGMDIPRDAHDQFKLCKEMNGNRIQPGDLIFFAKQVEPKGPFFKKVDHVMMYFGNELIIESTGRYPFKNRIINAEKKLGKPINQIKNGEQVGENIIQFGTFIGTFPNLRSQTTTTTT